MSDGLQRARHDLHLMGIETIFFAPGLTMLLSVLLLHGQVPPRAAMEAVRGRSSVWSSCTQNPSRSRHRLMLPGLPRQTWPRDTCRGPREAVAR